MANWVDPDKVLGVKEVKAESIGEMLDRRNREQKAKVQESGARLENVIPKKVIPAVEYVAPKEETPKYVKDKHVKRTKSTEVYGALAKKIIAERLGEIVTKEELCEVAGEACTPFNTKSCFMKFKYAFFKLDTSVTFENVKGVGWYVVSPDVPAKREEVKEPAITIIAPTIEKPKEVQEPQKERVEVVLEKVHEMNIFDAFLDDLRDPVKIMEFNEELLYLGLNYEVKVAKIELVKKGGA